MLILTLFCSVLFSFLSVQEMSMAQNSCMTSPSSLTLTCVARSSLRGCCPDTLMASLTSTLFVSARGFRWGNAFCFYPSAWSWEFNFYLSAGSCGFNFDLSAWSWWFNFCFYLSAWSRWFNFCFYLFAWSRWFNFCFYPSAGSWWFDSGVIVCTVHAVVFLHFRRWHLLAVKSGSCVLSSKEAYFKEPRTVETGSSLSISLAQHNIVTPFMLCTWTIAVSCICINRELWFWAAGATMRITCSG